MDILDSADDADVAVFDRGRTSTRLPDETGEWTPPRRPIPAGVTMRLPGDGPTDDHRIAAGVAWYASERFSGQAANDNADWPLAKLLRAERNEDCLALATRYRDLHDAATRPVELIGKDAGDDIYLLHRSDLDPSTGKLINKGIKQVGGKRALPAVDAKRAKPVPRRWNGDWPLLNKIDAGRELAELRGALNVLCRPFEMACIDGETLEDVGRSRGISNPKGAAGAGRALVFAALEVVDMHWRRLRAA